MFYEPIADVEPIFGMLPRASANEKRSKTRKKSRNLSEKDLQETQVD